MKIAEKVIMSLLVIAALSVPIFMLLQPTARTFSEIPSAEEVALDNTYIDPFYKVLEYLDYSEKQKKVIIFSYEKGKPYGLGYTLAAIAIRESKAGKRPINLDDPSFGYYHSLVSSVIDRDKLKNTRCNRNMVAARLVEDHNYAAKQAIGELLYWSNRYKGDSLSWSKMVMSYNAGTKYQNGKTYLAHIKAIIKELKEENE